LYPNSIMIQPANMEIANTYLADEKFKEAIPFLNNIITNKQNSSLKPEAYLKSGIAYYNADNNAEALKQFKILLKQYPQAPESEDAIDNIRSIFVEEGNPTEFVAFMAQIGRSLDVAQADSLIYTAAELQLSEGKKEAAALSLKQYLQQFPAGRYAISANYNLAELSSARKDFTNAAVYYAAVAEKAPNKYAEKAVLSAARIYYFELKDLPKAAIFFQQLKDMASSQDNRLEGMRGLLRCQFYGKQFAIAGDNARDLLQQSGAGNDDKTFANLVLGKNAQQKANYSEAINYYKTVIALNKAEYGAEARYETSAINKLAEAEKAAFEVIKKSGSYELWVTKAYILLGDIYFSQKDYFNAKATFKSVSENTAIAELKEEAAMKLAKVEAEEQARLGIGG
jgi:TolA-binding protein